MFGWMVVCKGGNYASEYSLSVLIYKPEKRRKDTSRRRFSSVFQVIGPTKKNSKNVLVRVASKPYNIRK